MTNHEFHKDVSPLIPCRNHSFAKKNVPIPFIKTILLKDVYLILARRSVLIENGILRL